MALQRPFSGSGAADDFSRRGFLYGASAAMGAGVCSALGDVPKDADGAVIPGFEREQRGDGREAPLVSDRKIRVGIAGYGLCKFGAAWQFQDHPNVEVIASSDLDGGRGAALAKAVGSKKQYPSCEAMIKDQEIEAVFIATDAPSHARLAIAALRHDKHVASAVPAVFGFKAEQDAQQLLEAVERSGKKYCMFETSSYHAPVYRYRAQYRAGALGKLVYSEGEYYHYAASTLGGYNPSNGKIDGNGWRRGLVPMWYPTHSTAFYVTPSGGRLTEVSCLGMPSLHAEFQPGANAYENRFGTEIALFKTSEGGMARMAVSWDMPSAQGEMGRVFGQKRAAKNVPGESRPPLPKGINPGHHGGSHGHTTHDFIKSILLDLKPYVDIGDALNMTMAGVIAHRSALKDGEWMKVPQYA